MWRGNFLRVRWKFKGGSLGGIEGFAGSLWGFIWESGGFVMSLPVVYIKHNFLFLEFVQAGAFVQTLQLYIFEFKFQTF